MLPRAWLYYTARKIKKPHQPRFVACEAAVYEIVIGFDEEYQAHAHNAPVESDLPKSEGQWLPQNLPEPYRLLRREFEDVFVYSLPKDLTKVSTMPLMDVHFKG